ncbi:hypothetical protein [Microbulbifer variabilis]|uniref:hypothetical protein n=1 Tax=Microbulbifer variabilis TaxID=266805 RepID=UPI001CFF00FE|nr:hypothetical protein [Microbulbifer variabilis]
MKSLLLLLLFLLIFILMLLALAIPSIINLLICFFIYKKIGPFSQKNSVNIISILMLSILLGFNVRIADIGREIFFGKKVVVHKQGNININQGSTIRVSTDFDKVLFKENVFDSGRFLCNEGAMTCHIDEPHLVITNINNAILNSGLKVSNENDTHLLLKINKRVNEGVATYDLRLLNENGVLAHETHRRVMFLSGEEYILERSANGLDNYIRYIFSNTFWDYILRWNLNIKQEPFLEGFINKNITLIPEEKPYRLLTSQEEGSERIFLEQYKINKNSFNLHSASCIARQVLSGSRILGENRQVSLSIPSGKEKIIIFDDKVNLNQIVCTEERIYLVYFPTGNSHILIVEYDYDGNYIVSDKILIPSRAWGKPPRISYFEKRDDNSYLIQIVEYSGKDKEPMNALTLTALEN